MMCERMDRAAQRRAGSWLSERADYRGLFGQTFGVGKRYFRVQLKQGGLPRGVGQGDARDLSEGGYAAVGVETSYVKPRTIVTEKREDVDIINLRLSCGLCLAIISTEPFFRLQRQL